MTAIIGFSARKQGGKNTCCNFILGNCLNSLGVVRGLFSITEEGQLYVSDVFGDESQGGVINMNRDNLEVDEFWKKNIDPYVKIYSFADALKDICINVLGLPKELVYGTNEQKETLTNLMWEDMAGVVTPERIEVLNDIYENNTVEDNDISTILKVFIHPAGRMTVREVMQYVGTDIFRKMYQNVWIDTLMRRIESDGSQLALICDTRFPGEVESISNKEGIVIRLTRNLFPENTHESETALDKENFNWENFDYVIDNQNITIPELNSAVYTILKETGMVSEETVA